MSVATRSADPNRDGRKTWKAWVALTDDKVFEYRGRTGFRGHNTAIAFDTAGRRH